MPDDDVLAALLGEGFELPRLPRLTLFAVPVTPRLGGLVG